ncbi:peptidoglycan-binding domain-containing protein [Streptomyces sp. 2RAF24]|uniref:peptidoglycan-binding domain-containing protein n=1 Tax=unclassified Streptomyces TaxID=2593676 RepID=UPI00340DEAFE
MILAEGMVGTIVAQVQYLLNHNNDYALKEDGKFGPATTAGVKAIQRCYGITVDGKVGPDTWKYLDYPVAGCGH